VSHAVRRGQFGDMAAAGMYQAPGFKNVTILHPPKYLPNSIDACRRWNEATYRRAVGQAARELGMTEYVLWVNAHWAGHCLGRMGEATSVYDVTDDWTSLTQSPRLRGLVVAQDAALCAKADAVIVCSQRLYEMKSPMAKNLYLVPNGVDADHYASVGDRSLPVPAVARVWQRPVFGYTGTIHPDRVDVALLEQVAGAMPHATFALVGPNYLPPAMMAMLAKRTNVVFTGPVTYTTIPDYMRAFDVGMVPHHMTPFTESLNPIKLWEYLAAGKPIVSTDVAGFRDHPRHVRIARGADEFVQALWAALEEGRSAGGWKLGEARRAEARKHSWTSRVDQIEAILESVSQRATGARKLQVQAT
jgi:teichuronic acid biosynthesis glycosyltransferase TuaH